jgi:hypothetical protein
MLHPGSASPYNEEPVAPDAPGEETIAPPNREWFCR